MKNIKVIIIIVCIVVLFIASFAFCNIILHINTHPVADTPVYTMPSIDIIPQKIRITKYLESSLDSDAPYVCYISDKNQLSNFVTKLNSIQILPDNIEKSSQELYKIELLSDNNTITLDVFDNKVIELNSSCYFLPDSSFSEIQSLIDVKYYLHFSNLEKPNDSEMKRANSSILSNLDENEKEILKKQIRIVHSALESHLANKVNPLKDSNNIYWEVDSSSGIFVQPNGLRLQKYGLWEYRDMLKELNELELNDKLHEIITDALTKLQYGIDNRDLSECFESHKILHDLDYWVVNYPLDSFYIAPTDWGGIDCYYGLIENYNIY